MSKRPLDPSDSLPSQHDHHAAARLPIHDLLSPNDNLSQSGPVKKPRSFIASVVCLSSLRCTVSNPPQACETCRLKKTRCDESRPQCGLCRSLGLECVYSERKSSK
jgi:hypothetical protein